MEQLFKMILSLSISGTLVGGIILLIRPVTKKCFSRRWSYYLWLLVLFRLLLPVHTGVNLMNSLYIRLPEWRTEWMREETNVPDRSEATHGSGNDNAKETGESEKVGKTAEGNVDAPGSKGSDFGINSEDRNSGTSSGEGLDTSTIMNTSVLLKAAAIIWLLGVMVCALWKIYDYRRFMRMIYRSAVLTTDSRILAQREECRARLGIKRLVPVYVSTEISCPMLIGFFGSCIVMPKDMPADTMMILHHELIHCRRRDIGYKWLFQLALCVHWFNPFIYLFNRKFNLDCELACDEEVMKLLTDDGRKRYGNVLLDAAEHSITFHKNVLAMTLLEEKSTLKERLEGIARYHKRGAITVLCSVTAVVVLFAVALMGGVVSAKESRGSLVMSVLSAVFGDGSNFIKQDIQIDRDGSAYRMYDDDELIADKDEHDVWRAWIYSGNERSTDCKGLILNGSDTLSILYANKDTTIEVQSLFDLQDGRLKFVHVTPEGKVNILNESGESVTETITLPQGKNVLKMVGQEARVENLLFSYDRVREKDFDRIFSNEEEECKYNLTEDIKSGNLDRSQLQESFTDMETEEVSELFKYLLEQDVTLYAEDWQAVFTYSDQHLSAEYLAAALKDGKADSFYSNGFREVAIHVNGDDWVEIVTSMQRLSYNTLYFGGLSFLNKSQSETCIMHYLDLGNTLTESQLQKLADYVSSSGLERIEKRNEEMRALRSK